MSEQHCAACKKSVPETMENPKKPGEQLCFDCLDKIAPEYVNQYPGWREREQARRRRAEIAKNNFSHREHGEHGAVKPEASVNSVASVAHAKQKGLFT